MTKIELQDWRSHFVTTNNDKLGLRYAPFWFTEQGVTMLACILKSNRVITVNIQIMRVFSELRERLTDTLALKLEIEEIKKILSNHDKNMALVFDYLDGLLRKNANTEPRKRIGYKSD